LNIVRRKDDHQINHRGYEEDSKRRRNRSSTSRKGKPALGSREKKETDLDHLLDQDGISRLKRKGHTDGRKRGEKKNLDDPFATRRERSSIS